MPFPHVDSWFQQDDKQIVENPSTSHLAKPLLFVEHIRSTLMFLKKYLSPTNCFLERNEEKREEKKKKKEKKERRKGRNKGGRKEKKNGLAYGIRSLLQRA